MSEINVKDYLFLVEECKNLTERLKNVEAELTNKCEMIAALETLIMTKGSPEVKAEMWLIS